MFIARGDTGASSLLHFLSGKGSITSEILLAGTIKYWNKKLLRRKKKAMF